MSDAPAAPWSDPHESVGEPTEPQVVVDAEPDAEPVASPESALDLDLVERDLADVELALARLDAGTYWTDEVTGAAIPDEVLAERPTARRAVGR